MHPVSATSLPADPLPRWLDTFLPRTLCCILADGTVYPLAYFFPLTLILISNRQPCAVGTS
jgi:hypothetical protein